MWCVYKHTCPNGKVYIGITGRDPLKRWNNGNGYKNNKHFFQAIIKYGWDNIKHEILFADLTKEEAEREEIEQIKIHDSTNREKGYNLSTGGGCCTGYSWKLREDQKKNISIAVKKRHEMGIGYFFKNQQGENNFFYGRHHTTEAKRKISEAQYRPVLQFEKSGLCVAEYSNCYQAELQTGIHHILEASKGKRKTAGGYVWRFKHDLDLLKGEDNE